MSDSDTSNSSLVDRLRNLADALAHGSGKTVEISYADIDLAANEIEFLQKRLSEALAMSPAHRDTEGRCICQDQHRRGYCTEPGCPYSSGVRNTKLSMSMFSNKEDLKQAELIHVLMTASTGDLFNALVRRINYDGRDIASITFGEMERAIDGAKLP